MTKVQLSELTKEDADKLMDNSKVWEKVTASICGDVILEQAPFLNTLKGLGRYSISDSSNRNNCLPVENSYDFLSSLEDACGYNVGILSDEQIDKANKLISDYLDSETDDQQEKIENSMDSLADKYASILLDSMVEEYDAIYDNDWVKIYLRDNLAYMYDDGAYYNCEDNSIYYMVKD